MIRTISWALHELFHCPVSSIFNISENLCFQCNICLHISMLISSTVHGAFYYGYICIVTIWLYCHIVSLLYVWCCNLMLPHFHSNFITLISIFVNYLDIMFSYCISGLISSLLFIEFWLRLAVAPALVAIVEVQDKLVAGTSTRKNLIVCFYEMPFFETIFVLDMVLHYVLHGVFLLKICHQELVGRCVQCFVPMFCIIWSC